MINRFMFGMLLLTFLISGCAATKYQKAPSAGFGFKDIQIQDDTYTVRFSGNSFTPKENVEDFALLRASELTLDKGYKYFIILDRYNITRQDTDKNYTIVQQTEKQEGGYKTTTTVSEENRKEFTIKCFNTMPLDDSIVYDAKKTYDSIAAIYGIK